MSHASCQFYSCEGVLEISDVRINHDNFSSNSVRFQLKYYNFYYEGKQQSNVSSSCLITFQCKTKSPHSWEIDKGTT
jgi:hypothetical protein